MEIRGYKEVRKGRDAMSQGMQVAYRKARKQIFPLKLPDGM